MADNPLGGMFAAPQRKPSTVQRIGNALAGFGAGVQGRGMEFVANQRAQEQALSQERTQAMIQDALAVDNLLANSQVEPAMNLMNQRLNLINELGGDPSDTAEVMQLVASGRVNEARELIGGFLGQAESMGLFQRPKPEMINASQLTDSGQAIFLDPSGRVSAQNVEGFTPAEQNANAANMGLSPVWLQDAQGNYVPAQLSSAGGLSVAQVPEGMSAMPSAGIMGFDPNAIQTRGMAQTGVDVSREQAMRPELAQTAGDVTAAQEEARIAAISPRSEAERAAELAVSMRQRGGMVQQQTQQLNLVNDLLNEAAEGAGVMTTGIGSLSRVVPGTPAADMAARLDSIRANIGFDKLQDMRQNSPTGGALGAVSDRENQLLQSVFSSLEQGQSEEQFLRNIERVRNQVQQSWQRIDDAYRTDYGIGYFEAEQAAQQLIDAEDLFGQADAILRGSGL
jgi:hypothetical protein